MLISVKLLRKYVIIIAPAGFRPRGRNPRRHPNVPSVKKKYRITVSIQLFRERLSGKVHATILKGIVGGFKFSFFQRNLNELARKAMEMCLRVLKESTKVGSTATIVRNIVLIISNITFRDCRVHTFSDNLSRKSCICEAFPI